MSAPETASPAAEIDATLHVAREAGTSHGPLRELASGIDALYLSGHCEPTPGFLARLEATRELAELVNEPMELYVGGLGFKLAPHGWGRYRYLLVHELGRVGVSTSQHLPPVRVQPRSELLHAVGPVATVEGFAGVLAEDCPDIVFTVTRVDLFSDWQGLQLDSDCRSRFSCRAATSRSFEVGGVVSGLDFGRRSTKTFSARIYDKTAEIERSGADWWKGVWGDAYRHAEQVWRVEVEIGRDGLASFGLATPAQVLAATSDLWRYATEEWLTYRVACGDQTRSRWDVAPGWRRDPSAPRFVPIRSGSIALPPARRRAHCGGSCRLSPVTWPPLPP